MLKEIATGQEESSIDSTEGGNTEEIQQVPVEDEESTPDMASYQFSIYTDASTSPLYIGEIPVFLIYRRIYLAVVHRRDISLSYIQTHLPRRCTSARRWFYIR